MSVGPWQIIIVALVILLLFGASRLGDIGKGLGEGIRNFKKGISDDEPPKQIPEGQDASTASTEKQKDKSDA